MQRSHPAGVGVCFEALPEVSRLSDAVHRLINDLGYFGIFEIEFLWFDGAWLAIDFNPRLFHQIGLDIRRGMPLPLLACLDAGGETDTLQNAVKRPKEVSEQGDFVFCDRFLLRAILLKRSLTAQVSRKDRSYWRSWRKRYAGRIVDAAADEADPLPGAIHVLSEIQLGLRALQDPCPLVVMCRAAPAAGRPLTKTGHRSADDDRLSYADAASRSRDKTP